MRSGQPTVHLHIHLRATAAAPSPATTAASQTRQQQATTAPAVPNVRHHQPLPQQHRSDGGAAVVPLQLRIHLKVLLVCFLHDQQTNADRGHS